MTGRKQKHVKAPDLQKNLQGARSHADRTGKVAYAHVENVVGVETGKISSSVFRSIHPRFKQP